MRRVTLAIAVVTAIVAAYSFGQHHQHPQAGSKTGRRVLYYVDPMHPAYKSDRPGLAPDCGMQLEPVFAEDAEKSLAAETPTQLPAGAVHIDADTQRLIGIRLASVERNSAARIIRVVGRVVPEDTRIYAVNSGVDGFVRETFGDSVGVRVKKDQKLASYYAPDIIPAASGFLAANERVPGAVSKEGVRSVQNYTDRLRNLGMSDVQIRGLADSRQLPESIDIVAPVDGFILARSISAGQHFTHDMEFYRIADLSKIWIAAEVDEREAPYLHPGCMARVSLRDGKRLAARITESLPQSQTGGGTVKLRLEADNPKFILRPDMLVDVELPVDLPAAITVPLDALIDTGANARVYVEQGDDTFEPREVKTGWRFGERVEILQGVQPGERVVASATFLVDSESRLKAPTLEPASARTGDQPASGSEQTTAATIVKDPSCGMPVDRGKATAAGNTLTFGGARYYFCSKKCKQAFQNDRARSRAKGGDRNGDD